MNTGGKKKKKINRPTYLIQQFSFYFTLFFSGVITFKSILSKRRRTSNPSTSFFPHKNVVCISWSLARKLIPLGPSSPSEQVFRGKIFHPVTISLHSSRSLPTTHLMPSDPALPQPHSGREDHDTKEAMNYVS